MSQIIERRKEFSFLWESQVPNKVVVAARGTGKTVAVLQFVLEKLLMGGKNRSAVFFSSTLDQVKKVVTPIMRQLTMNFPVGFCDYNKTDHTYRFRFSKDDVRELFLLSYEKPSNRRGFHPQIVILDECSLMPSSMFGEVILPMLQDSSCMLIAIGTPQGRNKFYELYSRGVSSDYPDWESYMIKASACKIFDSEWLWTRRNNMTSAEYAQEYECDFDANVLVGSVYGEFIDRYVMKGNIDDSYMWDPELPVYTAWDLGYADYTAIWFYQVKNDRMTFIDYYEDNGHDIAFYADYIGKKPYMYKTLFLPHDGYHNNIRGLPINEQLEAFGYHCERLPFSSEFEGIEKARSLLKTCVFNKTNCLFALQRLKSFRYKINKFTGEKMNTTEVSENSHCADAFRYAAISRKFCVCESRPVRIVVGNEYNVLY